MRSTGSARAKRREARRKIWGSWCDHGSQRQAPCEEKHWALSASATQSQVPLLISCVPSPEHTNKVGRGEVGGIRRVVSARDAVLAQRRTCQCRRRSEMRESRAPGWLSGLSDGLLTSCQGDQALCCACLPLPLSPSKKGYKSNLQLKPLDSKRVTLLPSVCVISQKTNKWKNSRKDYLVNSQTFSIESVFI